MAFEINTKQHQELKAVMMANDLSGRNILLWGQPGIGKTAFVNEYAQSYKTQKYDGSVMITLIGSTMDPQDVLGLPIVSQREDGKTEAIMAPPQWYYALEEANQQGKKPILFMDEINSAPPSVQAALQTLILDRRTSSYVLPEGTLIVAAANPPEYATDGVPLSPPLANRFCHYEVTLDVEGWIYGVRNAWGKENVSTEEHEVRSKVALFIEDNKQFLQRMPREGGSDTDTNNPVDVELAGKAWPSGRSWESAINGMTALLETGITDEVYQRRVLEGWVGEIAATKYGLWLSELHLPSYREVIETPEKVDWSTLRAGEIYAVIDNLHTSIIPDKVSPTIHAISVIAEHTKHFDSIISLIKDICEDINKDPELRKHSNMREQLQLMGLLIKNGLGTEFNEILGGIKA